MKNATFLIFLSALLMIWVATLQANAAMTDPKLLSEANLGRKAEVGAATDASNAAQWFQVVLMVLLMMKRIQILANITHLILILVVTINIRALTNPKIGPNKTKN
ncbi:hypothetical protein SLE2022_164480 [Rubroshorea leprosula]